MITPWNTWKDVESGSDRIWHTVDILPSMKVIWNTISVDTGEPLNNNPRQRYNWWCTRQFRDTLIRHVCIYIYIYTYIYIYPVIDQLWLQASTQNNLPFVCPDHHWPCLVGNLQETMMIFLQTNSGKRTISGRWAKPLKCPFEPTMTPAMMLADLYRISFLLRLQEQKIHGNHGKSWSSFSHLD